MEEQRGAYIYTRVSTAIQTEGFSLDAQKQRILEAAKYMHLRICGEYSDAGFSGKNISGRVQFQQMMADIAAKKDNVKYVLVFKLSRFGRNAADVLSSLQFMQDYGVNLFCVADNIDSAADSGKLLISVMSAVAEIERENILVQSMSGRKNKASKGGWNGGKAPYGYELQNGQLQIVEDEVAAIRDTFDLYISTNKGAGYVASELNKRYTKKVKHPSDVNKFTVDFVKRVVDNPIYCGKIAYGRTVSEKIEGKRNEFHRILQKDDSKIILSDGSHTPIISVETWEMARQKRVDNATSPEKVNKDHDYILAGLIRCPYCGTKMYGRMNGKKDKGDGTFYEPSYSYVCRMHAASKSVECPKPTSLSEKKLAKAVRDIIVSLVHDDGFHDLVERSLAEKFDAEVLTEQIEAAEKELRRLQIAKQRAETRLNSIDYEDKNADKLEESYDAQLRAVIDDIDEVECRLADLAVQMEDAQTLEDAKAGIYEFLEHFEEIYDMMDDADKRDFLKSFIGSIEVFPKEERKKGKWIKSIEFHFPMKMENGEMQKSISFEEDDDEDDNDGNDDGSGGNGGGNFPTLKDPRRAGGIRPQSLLRRCDLLLSHSCRCNHWLRTSCCAVRPCGIFQESRSVWRRQQSPYLHQQYTHWSMRWPCTLQRQQPHRCGGGAGSYGA